MRIECWNKQIVLPQNYERGYSESLLAPGPAFLNFLSSGGQNSKKEE